MVEPYLWSCTFYLLRGELSKNGFIAPAGCDIAPVIWVRIAPRSGAISQISHKSVVCLNLSHNSNYMILSKFCLVRFGRSWKEVCCCLRSSLCQLLPTFRKSLINDAISCCWQRVFKTKRICDPTEFSQKCCMPASLPTETMWYLADLKNSFACEVPYAGSSQL